ncbi:MAG: hypothetical protein H0W47_06000 [Polaromonas sp.]|uniref:hypothetical protein n=1 Tax=Polaromonas sp. TaxID=1869339 RepID=UPI0017EA511F|nr:hypothetical protein [Polaromonas sp.]MBA3593335.1 hypothetical protein [Polaromonas sp.]
MPSFISSFLRFVLRLVLWVFAAVFAVSLLAAALVVMTLGLLKALITGKKPQPMVFGRFQKFSPDSFWTRPGAPGSTAARDAEVVDVEVREIRGDKRLP